MKQKLWYLQFWPQEIPVVFGYWVEKNHWQCYKLLSKLSYEVKSKVGYTFETTLWGLHFLRGIYWRQS